MGDKTRAEFSKAVKLAAWRRARGYCERCKQPFDGRRPEYDHIKMVELGGDNSLGNCQVLCPKCHRGKTSMQDMPMVWKSNRIIEKNAGVRKRGRIISKARPW